MTERTETKDVVVERVMEAPIDHVWKMWTEPEHFAAWYGPPGAAVEVITMDVRVGGRRLVAMSMTTPDGPHRMWLAGEHLEIEPKTRIVYSEAMSDADGTILEGEASGMPDGKPLLTRIVVELEDLGVRTKMVMTHVGVPEDSPGAAGWEAAMVDFAAHLTTIEP